MKKIPARIIRKFRNLFFPHRGNNHRSKLLHHNSLSKIIVLLLLIQFFISFALRAQPGVLGYASNISVNDILNLTNQERQKSGLNTLSLNNSLSQSANAKASHMFSNNYWAHNAPDGTTPWYFFKSVGYTYLYAGENLARDFGDSSAVVVAWMDSPTHRENILSGRYDEIGIGVANGVLNGQETTLVVQHFGKQSSPAVAADVDSNATTAQEQAAEAPVIALQEEVDQVVEEVAQTQPPVINSQPVQEVLTASASRNVSAFALTKTVNLVITGIIIITLFIDGYVIYKNKMERRSGKNLVHIILFIIITIIIILSNSGKILDVAAKI